MFLTKTLMSCHVCRCHVLHAQLSKCNALHRSQCIWFPCLGCRQTHLDFEKNNGVQLRWSKRGWKITLNRGHSATGAAVKEVSYCFEIVSPSFSFKTKDQRHRDQGPKTKTKECYQYVWSLKSQLVLMLCSVRSRWRDLILGGHLLCFSTNCQRGKEPRTSWTSQQLLPARLKQDKEEIDISHSH